MKSTLVIILLFAVAFSVVNSASSMELPWEQPGWVDSNPGIISINGEQIWSPGFFEPSLDSLSLNTIDSSHVLFESRDSLLAAKTSYLKAQSSKNACVRSIEEWNSRQQGLNASFSSRLLAFVLGASTGVSNPGAGVVVGSTGFFGPEIMYGLQSLFFPIRFQDCISYREAWKDAVEYSFDALDAADENLSREYASFATNEKNVEFTGLCEEGYSGPGSTQCKLSQSARAYVDARSANGALAPYVRFAILQSSIQEQAGLSFPDFSNYSLSLQTAAQAQSVISDENTRLLDAYSQAQSDLLALELGLDAQDKLLHSKTASLVDDGVFDISLSGPSSDVPLSDRAESVTESLAHSQSLLSQEAQVKKQKLRSHLSISYALLMQAQSAYGLAATELAALDLDLDELVSSHAAAAEELLAKANSKQGAINSPEFTSSMQQAQSLLPIAKDTTKTRGERVLAYRKAIGFLNVALGTNQPTQAEISNIETQSRAIRSLLDNAKIDGLPVDFLESQYIAATNPLTLSSGDLLARIQDQTVLLARIKYGSLEQVRSDLLKAIASGGSTTQDLLRMMETKDVYFDGEGHLALPLAIGHLLEIKSLFGTVDSGLGQNIEDILQGGIEPQIVEPVPLFELDTPTTSKLLVSIINTQDTQGKNIDVTVPLSYPTRWLTQDITTGRNRVSLVDTSKSFLTVTLVEVSPYESIDLAFEHTAIMAHTLKNDESTVAAVDGSAIRTTTTDFDLDSPSRYALASDSIQIDGASSRRILEQGSHRMVKTELLSRTYSIMFGEPHVETALAQATIDQDITVNASVSLSKLSFALPLPFGAKDISILSKSGHVVSKVSPSSSVEDIFEVTPGRPAMLLLRYTIPSSNASIQSQANEILARTNSSSIRILVTEALSSPSEKDALALISKARNALIQEEQETANLKTRYDSLLAKYQSEQVRLQLFMDAMGDSATDPFVRSVAKRIEEIDSASRMPLPQAVIAFESLDKNWEQKQVKILLSQSEDLLSDLKKSVKATGADPRQVLEVEDALKALELSGSVEDAPALLHSLSKLSASSLDGSKESERMLLTDEFNTLKQNYSSSEQFYESTCQVLKETTLRTLCALDTSSLRKTLRDAEVALANRDSTLPELSDKVSKVRKASEKLVQFKKDITDLSSKSALNLGSLLDSRKSLLSRENQDRFESMLSRIESYNKNGEYAQGLVLGLELSKALKDAPKEDSSLVMLALGALIVLGIVAFFLLRQKGKPHVALKPLKRISREG